MTFRRMSTSRRARIFEQNDGICHICDQPIDGTRERWEVEHVIALEISRDDSDENLRPAHVNCHKEKTKEDAKTIAKCKRVEAKHRGSFRTRNPLPGSKNSDWKQKVNGDWVRRDEG